MRTPLSLDPTSRRFVPRRAALLALVAAILPLVWAGAASANTWPAYLRQRGGGTGYGLDGLQSTGIVNEKLLLDFAPLASGEPARVEATYLLDHSGEAEDIDLVFLIPDIPSLDLTGDGVQISLDGVALQAGTPERVETVWPFPTRTPALLSRPSGVYFPPSIYLDDLEGHPFVAPLTPGEHRLRVTYRVGVGGISTPDEPTQYRQFLYVLGPADDWKEFGRLDVELVHPPGWLVACEPPLTRSAEDTLTASFAGLPADWIAVTLVPANNHTAIRVANIGSRVLPLAFLLVPFGLLWKRRWVWALASLLLLPVARLARLGVVWLVAAEPSNLSDAYVHSFIEPVWSVVCCVGYVLLGLVVYLFAVVVSTLARARARRAG